MRSLADRVCNAVLDAERRRPSRDAMARHRLAGTLMVGIFGLAWLTASTLPAADPDKNTPPSPPVRWIRGEVDGKTVPLWGHAEGLSVGLHPLRGPRGLLRVYAPYLELPNRHVINFIAVEPIPRGTKARGLSELEHSRLDQTKGKRFWSANSLEDSIRQRRGEPATGWLEQVDGVECLRVWILVERFENGAHVYLRLTFRADRPHRVGIATFVHRRSVPLSRCIVTATMGNYSRLRRLHLAERVVLAGELWPRYRGTGFTQHAEFPLSELQRTPEGGALAIASPNEANPVDVNYSADTRRHWRYQGKVAQQSWLSTDPDPQLKLLVNGRTTYWASESPIPGGVAFENFELVAPFRQGEEFWFIVEPLEAR